MRPDQRLTAEHPRGVALVHDKVHAQVIIPVFCQENNPIESGLVEQSIRTICMLTKKYFVYYSHSNSISMQQYDIVCTCTCN